MPGIRKDIIIFGAVAGALGNIVKLVIASILYFLNILKYTYVHLAAGYFAETTVVNNTAAFLNGIISDFFYASFLGILFYLALIYTDMRYAKIKGLLFGGFIHIANNGVLVFASCNSCIGDHITFLILILTNMIFGLSTCWILEKYSG